jgi:HSP20 family molecular chaperone IbpA
VENRADTQRDQQLEQTRPGAVLAPSVDILENDKELLIVADLPGVDPGGIKLDVQPPDFKLEAELAGAAERTTYQRSFHVKERIDVERVNADYKHGVLTVRLPKSSAVTPRRIEVRSA